jgi:hypothetical protein
MSADYQENLKKELARHKQLRGEQALEHVVQLAKLAENQEDEQTVVWALCRQIQLGRDLDQFAPRVSGLQKLYTLYTGNPRYDFARERVLWYHKWVAEVLVEHADISREAIDAMFQRLDALYTRENMGLRPSYALRCRTAWIMGRNDEARGWYEKWEATSRGKSDDCAACEINATVEYLLACDEMDKAMEAAQPLFRGKAQCLEVPAITYSRLLGLALNQGNTRLAEAMHRSTVAAVRREKGLLACLGRHIVYRSLTGRAQASRRLAALALGRAAQVSDYNKFGALLSGAIWFSLLVHEGVDSMKLPGCFPPAAGDRRVRTPEGAAWCLEKARELGERFDARNGTPFYSQRLNESENLIRQICKPD